MNLELTKQIIRHIYASLKIIPSDFINYDNSKSALSKDFLLKETLDLNDSTDLYQNKIWGCTSSTGNKSLNLLVANCSIDKNILEYCLIFQLEDAPSYGLYLVSTEGYNSDAMIACTLNGTNWMECNTYLQATFLAGMEQIKDSNLDWVKSTKPEDQINLLKSFLRFHNSVYGEINEG
jgi:hypothetical protein